MMNKNSPLFIQVIIIIIAIIIIEECLHVVHDWFLWNELALSSDKTEVMVFRSSAKLRHLDPISTVSITGAMVPLVDTIESLTVTSDTKLSFYKHLNNIS